MRFPYEHGQIGQLPEMPVYEGNFQAQPIATNEKKNFHPNFVGERTGNKIIIIHIILFLIPIFYNKLTLAYSCGLRQQLVVALAFDNQ
jgi:hypothetical protein